jgi:hypothetical protein
MPSDIILIGPVGAGKSTQGKLLAEKLGMPHCRMDEVRWGYYREIGYSEEEQKRILAAEGFFPGVHRYWRAFEAHAVERVLADHPGHVIDFGAGHSIYGGPHDGDPELLARVQRALAPYPNVVLLLPSPDAEESVRLLRARSWDGMADGFDVHDYFVRHPANHALAKKTVYTKDRTPEETRDEIIAAVSL